MLTGSIGGVDPDHVLDIAIAFSELANLHRRGHVVLASDQVIPVFAVIRRSDRVETRFEAELVIAHETV